MQSAKAAKTVWRAYDDLEQVPFLGYYSTDIDEEEDTDLDRAFPCPPALLDAYEKAWVALFAAEEAIDKERELHNFLACKA